MRKAVRGSAPPGQLRLIGGRFGGRRLAVPDQPGLRPTGDRTRETLFNWLQPLMPGSRCLDLFAGSGALGFEALSRGAARVTMLERNARVAHQLRAHGSVLMGDALADVSQSTGAGEAQGAGVLEIHASDSLRWLASAAPTPFDIVFLDPPFAAHLLPASLRALSERPWLAPGARLYLETAVREPFPELPTGWTWLREKTAGQVRFGLVLADTAD